MANVPLTRKPSVMDQIEQLHDRIAARAFALFKGRNGFGDDPLADWLSAERELVWAPAIEVRETDGSVVVQAALPGVDAKDITVDVTPRDVVVKAESGHQHTQDKGTIHRCEFVSGEAFRAIELPKPIDVAKAKADFQNGMLRITAPIAAEALARRVEISAA